jgi:hypothetical protein
MDRVDNYDTVNTMVDDPHQRLLDAIIKNQSTLEGLLSEVDEHWGAEDLIYRFWHQSMKVYWLQSYTERIALELVALAPDNRGLHPWFVAMMEEGTGKTFALEHNDDWLAHTRPIVEAFFHAHYMLSMAVTYGRELKSAPQLLPSGWAMLLELYQIR